MCCIKIPAGYCAFSPEWEFKHRPAAVVTHSKRRQICELQKSHREREKGGSHFFQLVNLATVEKFHVHVHQLVK